MELRTPDYDGSAMVGILFGLPITVGLWVLIFYYVGKLLF